ncbi:MAG: GDSL-type esterase/lipase family protein [Verrucomicrobiota bacterium]|jgi:beta-glucosidase
MRLRRLLPRAPGVRSALTALLLALFADGILQAQDTNAPASVPPYVPEVARYPKSDDLFPGKGPAQKGDWFVKIWTERRSEFWSHRGRDERAVVFLGDSITQGWNGLAGAFPDLKTANRGIGGDTTRGILYRLKEDVLDLHPVAVVLLIGTNDLGLGARPQEVADNVRMILERLGKANPHMPVIVCKVMPSDPSKERPPDRIKALNALVDAVVKENPNWIRCDTWSIYANAKGNCAREEFPDLLHPNAMGYAKWVAALTPIFARLNLPG